MPSRMHTETYNGVPIEEADRLVAKGSPTGATCQIVAKPTPKTANVVCERPFSLNEELVEDARLSFKQIMLDFVDAPPWPADIDAWRVAYDPMRAADRWLERKGIDPGTVSTANKVTLAAVMEIAGAAIIFGHGKAPGAPEQD